MDTPLHPIFLRLAQPVDLQVRSFRIRERMNELFELSLTARSPHDDLDFDGLVGQEAAVSIEGPLRWSQRRWKGVVSDLAQVGVADTVGGDAIYEVTIRPKLWLLTQRRNHRLFQHISIPEIVDIFLAEWQVVHEWRILEQRYPPLELRTQYGEDDFSFLCRLFEEAGISFFFEHDGENTQFILHDEPQSADARGFPVRFQGKTTDLATGQTTYAEDIRLEQRTTPGKFTLRDYDFRQPRLNLLVEAPPEGGEEARLEQYHYAPGALLAEGHDRSDDSPVADDLGVARFSPPRGVRRATIMQNAVRGQRRRVSFDSNALDLWPGVVFAIGDYPHPELTIEHSLLAVGFELSGAVDDAFESHVTAVLASLPYRPPISTPKPKIVGTQSAVVVGPDDEEIYVDEFGRVRVQFHWDREGVYDPNSSIWVRVSQGWAGAGWGAMMIPRIGQEVLIDYLEGDVDHPLIVGRVYNAVRCVPYKLPENKTVTTIRTDSTPGGSDLNYNEIKFEDKRTRELVFVQAEKDQAKLVKNDETALVGRDRVHVVTQDELFAVQNDRRKVVERDEASAIGRDRVAQVRRDEALAVGRDATRVVLGRDTETVGVDQLKSVVANRTTRIGNEEKTFVGSRMSWKMAPKLGESLAQGMSDVLDGPVGDMLGPLPPRLADGAREAGDYALESGVLNALADLL
ncbi:MAG: type VI secretion system tip protein TssI/VgrG, partial [Myxococcota bacterium]